MLLSAYAEKFKQKHKHMLNFKQKQVNLNLAYYRKLLSNCRLSWFKYLTKALEDNCLLKESKAFYHEQSIFFIGFTTFKTKFWNNDRIFRKFSIVILTPTFVAYVNNRLWVTFYFIILVQFSLFYLLDRTRVTLWSSFNLFSSTCISTDGAVFGSSFWPAKTAPSSVLE